MYIRTYIHMRHTYKHMCDVGVPRVYTSHTTWFVHLRRRVY